MYLPLKFFKRRILKGALSGLKQFLATDEFMNLFHLESSFYSQDI